jgi:hypothetical protein
MYYCHRVATQLQFNKYIKNIKLFFENRAVYEKMCKHIVELEMAQMTLWRMHISRRVPKATTTHSEYVILIAIPLQQWLHKRASIFLYTYVVCFVKC